MVIYEFSKFLELFYICIRLIPTVFVIGLVLKYGTKYLEGKLKLVLIIPLCYLGYISVALIEEMDVVEQYDNKIEQANLVVARGKLISISHEERKSFFKDSLNTPVFTEVIELDNSSIVRMSPRVYSGDNGCLITPLKDELSKYSGEVIEFKYVERRLKNIVPILICILKVEVIEG